MSFFKSFGTFITKVIWTEAFFPFTILFLFSMDYNEKNNRWAIRLLKIFSTTLLNIACNCNLESDAKKIELTS